MVPYIGRMVRSLVAYNAIGNFDNDAFPEIVLVSVGWVYLFRHDGTLIWGPVNVPGLVLEVRQRWLILTGMENLKSGLQDTAGIPSLTPPEISNGLAATQDQSSEVTGSSVFDFDGDGAPEVVYRDETQVARI